MRQPRRRKRQAWDLQWRDPALRPGWLVEGPRDQVRQAQESGWIPPGASVLDVGCGLGHTAAWLASLGHAVTGIDVAGEAVRRARREHAVVPGLRFKRANVGGWLWVTRRYDVVLDLGCVHQLPDADLPRYAANVRRLSRPGTRLLYLMRLEGDELDPTPEEKGAELLEHLGPEFTVQLAEATELQGPDAREVLPGVELRFIRR